ncbi:MAG TPA: bifunctional DNA-formamidopyrimidine glycosylase/DNA-(apurinic or apyrimidinic site) lyase [Anaerolineae bacterium]|nr:bifunctional DNA-formamidopyrimidine glycosylase/DNA-(apurinic or apyrimidinic site) lyase [Anaerolineae bacterium]
MPELPEVENTVRDLKPLLVGRHVLDVHILWPRLVQGKSPEAFAAELTGRQIVNTDRRGKYLLFPLDNERTWIVHLRMTGQLHLVPAQAEVERHVHAVLDLDNGQQLRYRDARKFGRFYLVDEPASVVGQLGPEPLSEEFTPLELFNRLQGRRTAIKTLLLDQRVVAGLGNIYADEALFSAGLDPRRPASTLTQADCNRLHTAIRQTLATAIREGGSSLGSSALTNYRRPTGVQGRFQQRHQVYQRAGHPCPVCGAPIERIRLGQRSTHFCPHCQYYEDVLKTG